ncbi:MAG: hypothetical protein U0Q22_06990 [Acidimicrobiales bacterium]
MTYEEALALLGLGPGDTDEATVRAAYLVAIRATHPDLHDRSSATADSAAVIAAYELLISAPTPPLDPSSGSPAGRPQAAEPGTEPGAAAEMGVEPGVDVVVIADDTIEVAAPVDLTYALLLQAAHDAAEVTFLDRSAAILQIVVEFVDEPVCQVIFDLQGRAARGTTEIFCTIESLEERPAPPIEAVTQFVAAQLAGAAL